MKQFNHWSSLTTEGCNYHWWHLPVIPGCSCHSLLSVDCCLLVVAWVCLSPSCCLHVGCCLGLLVTSCCLHVGCCLGLLVTLLLGDGGCWISEVPKAPSSRSCWASFNSHLLLVYYLCCCLSKLGCVSPLFVEIIGCWMSEVTNVESWVVGCCLQDK